MLDIQNVTKRFGGLTAVRDVSMKLEKGEVLGIIGPNGSGKTTLLNLISGIYEPSRGSIFLENERIDNLRPHERARRGIARTFQIPKPFAKISVLENMLLPAIAIQSSLPTREPLSSVKSRANELLELVGLAGLKDENAGSLSGGQQKLLDFVRALMLEPKVVLGDEILAGVHPEIRAKLIPIIATMAKEGKSFALVSHEIGFIMEVSEKIMFMVAGQKIVEGTPDDVRKDERVVQAYLGR